MVIARGVTEGDRTLKIAALETSTPPFSSLFVTVTSTSPATETSLAEIAA